MRKSAFRILCALFPVFLLMSTSVSAGYHEDKGCRECTLDLSDGGWLYITAGSETFYTWQNVGLGCVDDLYVSVDAVNRPFILGRFIKIADKTVEVLFRSSNETVIVPVEKGHFRIVGPGQSVISISAEDKQIEFPVNVVSLPFARGASVLDVIKTLGLPDYETRVYIPWPESQFVDGIFYYRKDNGLGRQVHHWMYKAYPGLILSLDEDARTVQAIYNLSWYTSWIEWMTDNR